MDIYGVLASENVDNAGEILKVDGVDTSKLRSIIDEHAPDGHEIDAWHTIGAITYHKKIFSERDCENPRQKYCWDRTKAPLIYIEGKLADDADHPNAKAAAALLRFCAANKEVELKPGFSIDGGIAERQNNHGQVDPDGKILSKTLGMSAAWTLKPCNPKCFVLPMNDLQKSQWSGPPPKIYFEALKKSQAKSSIIQNKDLKLYMSLVKLKKSLKDFYSGFTSMSCKRCANGVRFFKNSKDIPNRCQSCQNPFSASELWDAINK